MTLQIATFQERPELAERLDRLDAVWPEFNRHGDVLHRYWGRLRTDFPEFQLVLFDEAKAVVVGKGHTIPFAWDGSIEGLPEGIDAVIEQGVLLRERQGQPTTLSALAAVVDPARSRAVLGAQRLDAPPCT